MPVSVMALWPSVCWGGPVVSGYVFVSYSRRDSDYVTRLVDHVQAGGVEVWFDTEQIHYGDRWEHVIRDRVDGCAAMIVVMSPAAEASPHVGNELARARRQGKPILPVLLSGSEFFALGGAHRFDARDGDLPDPRFIADLAVLAAHGRSADPPAASGGDGQLVVGDPPGEAVSWQDRPYLLEATVATAGTDRATVVSALAGQRGVGKTQLAAAYARLRIQHGWPVVVWANAETEDGIVAALDELAGVAGLPEAGADPQSAARAALRWLRAHPGPCLLVYDNAVDADLVRSWTPTIGSVHTVATTTHRDLGGLGPLIDVTLFTDDEAVSYLHRRTGLDDPDGAGRLAEHLGRLPLALAQAGALLGTGRRYPSYQRYLQAMAKVDTGRLLPRTPGDPYPRGLAETVLLSLDDLARTDTGPAARQLLDRLAVLAPTGADPALLNHLATDLRRPNADWPPEPVEADENERELVEVDELDAVLTGRSFTVPADDNDHLVVHRLIQRVVREHAQQAGTLDAIVTSTATAVHVTAEEATKHWRDRALLIEYADHAQTLLTHAIGDRPRRQILRLLQWLLYWLNVVGSHTTSITIGPAYVAELERSLGAEHPDTLTARHNLAIAYWEARRTDEAIALHIRNLAVRERIAGDDHRDTLNTRHGLAIAYRAADRLDEAIALYTRTLPGMERVLGDDHPETLKLRHNFAIAYREAGRLDEAIALHTRSLTDMERVLGDDHRDTLKLRHSLAIAYRAAGRLDEAIALYTRTLPDMERVLGDDHPDTLRSRHSFAIAYRAAGRLDEAIALHIRSLTGMERVLGDDHPDTASSRRDLANAYQAAGQPDKARALRNKRQ
jgi:tetratricopeptide (TPR) repeat protein